VTRVLRVIVHNWPLKLAAIGMASLLYAGLVLSQSSQTFAGQIPIEQENKPPDTFVVTVLPPVTEVRYFAPSGVPPITSTFRASVDLSDVEPGAGLVSVPVSVEAIDPRITVIGFTPAVVNVQLDSLERRVVPVEVERGTIPEGLEVGETTVDPPTVTVIGPKSVVDQVVAARADVVIDPDGLDVDQDVLLVPVDQLGNALSPVDVDPRTARVTIPVFSDRQSLSLPVSPVITGTPAAGFEVESVTVTPTTVTVEGDADELVELAKADTEAISVSGASADFARVVALDLPAGVAALGQSAVEVAIKLRPVTATRNFEAGLRLVGAQDDLLYSIPVDRVTLTIGGSVADLDRLEGVDVVGDLAVGDLGPGATNVPVTIDLPTGLTLVTASPPTITVSVSTPPSPSPSATPPGVASPSPSPS
jgi:YbbR domain-containing protein